MDSTGKIIHKERMYDLHIPKDTTRVFTEFVDFNSSIGENIKNVSAEIYRESKTKPLLMKVIHTDILRGKFINLSQKPIMLKGKFLLLDQGGYALDRRYFPKISLKAREVREFDFFLLLHSNPIRIEFIGEDVIWKSTDIKLTVS